MASLYGKDYFARLGRGGFGGTGATERRHPSSRRKGEVDRFIPNRTATLGGDRKHWVFAELTENRGADRTAQKIAVSIEEVQHRLLELHLARRFAGISQLPGRAFIPGSGEQLLRFAPPRKLSGAELREIQVGIEPSLPPSKEVAFYEELVREVPACSSLRTLDAPNMLDDFYSHNLQARPKDPSCFACALGEDLYLYNATTKVVTQIPLHEEGVDGENICFVQWSPCGKFLIAGEGQQSYHLLNLSCSADGKLLLSEAGRYIIADSKSFPIEEDRGKLRKVAFCGARFEQVLFAYEHKVEGTAIFLRELSGTSFRRGETALNLDVEEGAFQLLRNPHNRNEVMIGTNSNTLHCFDVAKRSCSKVYEMAAAVRAMSWHGTKSSLLAFGGGTADKRVILWNPLSGKPAIAGNLERSTLEVGAQVMDLLFLKNYLLVATGYDREMGGSVLLYKVNTSNPSFPTFCLIKKIEQFEGQRVLSMSMMGGSLCVSSSEERINIYDLQELIPKPKPKKQALPYSLPISLLKTIR